MFEYAEPAALPDYQAGHGLGLARPMPNKRHRPITARLAPGRLLRFRRRRSPDCSVAKMSAMPKIPAAAGRLTARLAVMSELGADPLDLGDAEFGVEDEGFLPVAAGLPVLAQRVVCVAQAVACARTLIHDASLAGDA